MDTDQDIGDVDFLRLPGPENMDVAVSWHNVGEIDFQARGGAEASDGMSTVPDSPDRDRDCDSNGKERRSLSALPTDKFLSMLDQRYPSGYGVKLEPREARLTSVGSDRDLEAGFEFGFFPTDRVPSMQGAVPLPPIETESDTFRSSSPRAPSVARDRRAGSSSAPPPSSAQPQPSSSPHSPAESPPPVQSPRGAKAERRPSGSPPPPAGEEPPSKRRRSMDSGHSKDTGSNEEEGSDEEVGEDGAEGEGSDPDSPGGEAGTWGGPNCKEKKVPFEQLLPLMGRSLAQAAKALNMCPTTLKKICRRYGISRWPSRKLHRIARESKLDTEGLLKSGGRLETLLVESGIRKVNSIAFTRKDLMPKRLMGTQQQQPWTTAAHQQAHANASKGYPPTRAAHAAAAAAAAAAPPEPQGGAGQPQPQQPSSSSSSNSSSAMAAVPPPGPSKSTPPLRAEPSPPSGPVVSGLRPLAAGVMPPAGPSAPPAGSPPAAPLPPPAAARPVPLAGATPPVGPVPSPASPPDVPAAGGSPPPSLMDEEEEEAALDPETVVSVKVTFACCGEIMRFRACPARTTLAQVEKRIAEGCSRMAGCPKAHSYKLRFTDEDGDLVILTRPADLHEMFSIAASHMSRKALIKALPCLTPDTPAPAAALPTVSS